MEVRKSVKSDVRRLASLYLTFIEQSHTHGDDAHEMKEGNSSALFNCKNFGVLSESVTVYTTYNTSNYYFMKKACKNNQKSYLADGLDKKMDVIDKFVAVPEFNQNYLFGDATYSLNKNRQTNPRKPMELPLESDVKQLHDHSLYEVQSMMNDKLLFWNRHEYVKLGDLTGSRLTLFNARRRGSLADSKSRIDMILRAAYGMILYTKWTK